MKIHTACDNCQGDGIIPKFAHIQGGKCFNCNGKGGWTKAQMDAARIENERKRQRNIAIVTANNAQDAKAEAELIAKREQQDKASENPNGTHGLKGRALIRAARQWVKEHDGRADLRQEFLKEFGWSNSRLLRIAQS